MAPNRYYGTGVPATTLYQNLGSTGNPVIPASYNIAQLPSSYPYTMLLDWNVTNSYEVITVTGPPTGGGPYTLPCLRGQDGTTAVSHTAGAVVNHGVSARDFQEPQNHLGASSAVHGLAGTVVGTTDTQTLTNKTFTNSNFAGVNNVFPGVSWVNVVTQYGADPTGATDSTAAIQAALNATPLGGITYVPAGKYAVNSQITIPKGVTLRGDQSYRAAANSNSYIRPSATFAGASVFTFIAGTPSGAIENLVIDGTNLPGGNTVDGIDITGGAKFWQLIGLQVRNFGGYGIYIYASGGNPDGGYMRDLSVSGNTLDGIYWSYCVDGYATSLHVDGNGASGIHLGNMNNTILVGCKAQQNTNHGYYMTGSSDKANGAFIGCDSENNSQNGFSISGVGNAGALSFVGCSTRDDGVSGTSGSGFIGFNIANTSIDILMTGCSNYITASTAGPDYGLNLTNVTGSVAVSACTFIGSVAAYHSGGGNSHVNFDSTTIFATGQSDATRTVQTNLYLPTVSATSVATGTSGDAYPRVNVDNTGKINFGSGAIATDTDLYRGGAGILTTDSSLDVIGHSLGIATPRDFGLIAWAFDPVGISANQSLTSGTIYLSGFYVSRSVSISNILWGLNTGATGVTASQNYIGIYNSSGVVQGSPIGIDSAITGSGVVVTATGGISVTPGFYWIGWVVNATGSPALSRSSSSNIGAVINLNTSNAASRFATNSVSQITLPTITTSSNTKTTYGIWSAVS